MTPQSVDDDPSGTLSDSETSSQEVKVTTRQLEWIVEQAKELPLLDLGCGKGELAILLARRGIDVIGVDTDAAALDACCTRLAQQPSNVAACVKLIHANPAQLIMASNSVGTVLIQDNCFSSNDVSALVTRCLDVLRPSGSLILRLRFGQRMHEQEGQEFILSDCCAQIEQHISFHSIWINEEWLYAVAPLPEADKAPRHQVHVAAVLRVLEEACLRIKASERVSRKKLRSELERREETEQLNRELQQQVRTEGRRREEIEQLNRELQQRARTERGRRVHTERINKQLERNIDLARKRESALRGSIRYRLGDQLIYSLRRPWRTVILPLDLTKLLVDALHRRRKHGTVVRPTNSTSLLPQSKRNTPSPQKEPPRLKRTIDSKNLATLKVATIMDAFTFEGFRHECQLLQLSPEHWEDELGAFVPDILFIESAWEGKEDKWQKGISRGSDSLSGIISWCKRNGVPTAFWNKEDPVHFLTFINVAEMFDYVFTTDVDCIARYKAVLRHDNVLLLPFACQPAIHNPLEKYERKNAFCFAGSYYTAYADRARDFESFVEHFSIGMPVEIYDRANHPDNPSYQFPAKFQQYIVGSLPYEHIDRAYKGYARAISLNSIKQSQSMFGRRVFELLACNTITASNFSRGQRLFFADLVACSDEPEEITQRLDDDRSGGTNKLRKLSLAGLRKVMHDHTYQDRLSYVVSSIQRNKPPRLLPNVLVIGVANDQRALESLLSSNDRQNFPQRHLMVIASSNLEVTTKLRDGTISLVGLESDGHVRIVDLMGECTFVASMAPEDYYGPNYLTDLVLATRYTDAPVVTKKAHYKWSSSDGLELLNDGSQYRLYSGPFEARASLVRLDKIVNISVGQWARRHGEKGIDAKEIIAIDEFNYCRTAGERGFNRQQEDIVCDLKHLDEGIHWNTLSSFAARVPMVQVQTRKSFDGKQLAQMIDTSDAKGIKLRVIGTTLRVQCDLEGTHLYRYAKRPNTITETEKKDGLRFLVRTATGQNVRVVVIFLNSKQERIGHVIAASDVWCESPLAEGTMYVKFGLRFAGVGETVVEELVFDQPSGEHSRVLARSRCLILTNIYPSYRELYRNAFVHSRAKAYAERGIRMEVFCFQPNSPLQYREFENIDVVVGDQQVLAGLLSANEIRSVCVHFLNEKMWKVLEQHLTDTAVYVWLHGAEIQPWHRRTFLYKTESQRAVAKARSSERLSFWRALFSNFPKGLHLVFVSNYFAEEVMGDLGVRLAGGQYSILHNPIDTELFEYIEKPVEQRKRILSIRPYASEKYANDLSVRAILELTAKPYFDDLEFLLIGDGRLFDEVVEPVRHLSTVRLERRFLRQGEIAELHREYGIFLCPTRMDSQGVSRDEAMSSGLVPVTNAVAAVPEFVDESCGILVPAEDYVALARGIARLVEEPEMFAALSKAAASRVRRQSARSEIIGSELRLIGEDVEGYTSTRSEQGRVWG